MGVIAYKGFNKDMTCRGFQFKEGETYHEDEAELCKKGFHACLEPLDCFDYYNPAESVYHEVEVDDVDDKKSNNDSKVCGKTIKVGAALDIAGIVKAHINIVKNEIKNAAAKKSAGDDSTIGAGNGSTIGAGDGSTIGAGAYSKIGVGAYSTIGVGAYSTIGAGKNSIIAAFNSKARAGINSFIALANREWNGKEYVITDYAAAIVDGKKIKSDTWYVVKNGEFVEVTDDEN